MRKFVKTLGVAGGGGVKKKIQKTGKISIRK